MSLPVTSGSQISCACCLQEFYETTLRALEKARNDRLWFKTNLKLCNLWFKAKEYNRMHKILKDLHKSVRRDHDSR